MQNMLGLVRGALISLIAGIVIFVGGVVAIALKAVPVGGVLLALGVLSVCVGWVLMYRFRNRARASSADAQARWQAVRDGASPDGRG
jgi:uncharacterized membrane protein YgdD (TMEM256/DUF423 family)